MAKTTAPLLSFGASGALAQAMVFATWRGISYVRRYVVPENPRTAAQTLTRDIFRTLSDMWKVMGSIAIAPWQTFAISKPLTDRNAMMGKNIASLRGDVNMNNFIGSPAARGGLAPDGVVAVAGVGTITITFTNPAPPTGWTLVAAQAIAFPDQAPEAALVGPVTEAEDAASPFDTVVLTGLGAVLHQCSCWLKWTKPDGLVAYGASINVTETPA